MGFDWEEILGAEGDDIQSAYDESVAQADRYDEDERRRRDAERRMVHPAPSASTRPKPTPIAYRHDSDIPPFLGRDDIVLKPGQEVPEGYRAG